MLGIGELLWSLGSKWSKEKVVFYVFRRGVVKVGRL